MFLIHSFIHAVLPFTSPHYDFLVQNPTFRSDNRSILSILPPSIRRSHTLSGRVKGIIDTLYIQNEERVSTAQKTSVTCCQ